MNLLLDKHCIINRTSNTKLEVEDNKIHIFFYVRFKNIVKHHKIIPQILIPFLIYIFECHLQFALHSVI